MNGILLRNKIVLSWFSKEGRSSFIAGLLRSLLIIAALTFITTNELKAQDETPGYDDLSVLVQLDGYGSFYTNALYSSDGLLYISVEDLFKYLKIPCSVGEKGDSLSGFLGDESRRYIISYKSAAIRVNTKVTSIKKGLAKQMGSLFLESSLFGPLTGINLNFNFRSLSIKVNSEFELPAIKEQRLEKIRTNIKKSTGEVVADTTLGRYYHNFRSGMADWSVMSSQYNGREEETQLGLGLGTELLRGELNLFLNYSDQYKLDNRLQQYLWRWVDNDKKIISQIQVGKIVPQTISSLYNPVVGAVISNAPTSVRKAMGEYLIKEVTQPDWLVELYINNSLVDFTKADASGQFMFKVPMVYGYTTIMLRYYGPMGEERSESKVLNIPYSFLPAGEFQYRVSAGFLEDGKRTPFGRGEATLGVNRFLTLGMGVEYMASVAGTPTIPFVSASFMPVSKMMLFVEYDHHVRFKGLMNYYPGANSTLEIEYTRYVKNQQAILFNYLEERKISFSLPLKVNNIAGLMRLGYKQNVYSNLNYNMTELLFSAYYKQLNVNLSSYANWVNHKSAYMNSMFALSYRLRNGFTVRSSAQFSLSGRKIISYKAEAEKRFLHNGYVSVSFENYTATRSNSVNFSFKYDLSYAQTNASARISNHEVSTFQNARGSLAFGKGKKHIQASELSNVGRGGISVIPFIDVNHNGVYDKNEPRAANLKVRINGGRVLYNDKDSVINIIGLEPFISYTLEVEDKEFENLAWHVKDKSYKVLIDPNQFKDIFVPVIPQGEVNGTVTLESNNHVNGIGRILVDFYNKKGLKVAQSLTESDGFFEYMGLEPGEFTVRVDSVQLSRLNLLSSPAEFSFRIRATKEGDIVEDVKLNLKSISDQVQSDSAIFKLNTSEPGTADTAKLTTGIPVKSDSIGRVIDKSIAADITGDEIDKTLQSDSTLFINETDNDVIIAPEIPDIKLEEPAIGTNPGNDSLGLDDGHYYVQVGAFRLLSKAKNLVVEMSAEILYPEGIVVEDGYYKVRIGYFRLKSDASRCEEMLKKKKIESFMGQTFYSGFAKNRVLNAGAFYVGLGSFRYKKDAVEFAEKIKGKVSYTTGIIAEEGLFKVRLGYFESRSEAMTCLMETEKSGIKASAGESKSYIYSGTLVPEIKEIYLKDSQIKNTRSAFSPTQGKVLN